MFPYTNVNSFNIEYVFFLSGTGHYMTAYSTYEYGIKMEKCHRARVLILLFKVVRIELLFIICFVQVIYNQGGINQFKRYNKIELDYNFNLL